MRKKTWAIACATIFVFFGASCTSGLFAEKDETSFVVNCDYGVHVQGKVTYLLAGSSIFFSYDEYEVQQLLLGDIVTIEYTGDMTISESQPSKIEIDGRIQDIDVDEAEIMRVKYDGVNIVADGKQTYTFEKVPQYVIKDGAGNFMALEEVQADTLLYATYRECGVKGKSITLDGLYAYEPRK